MAIEIGKGATRTLTFKIKTDEFVQTDTLLFAMELAEDEETVVMEYRQPVDELMLEAGVYNFIVPLKSEFTITLDQTDYLFDVTLVDQYGEKTPLMKPETITITNTVGASIPENNSGGE